VASWATAVAQDEKFGAMSDSVFPSGPTLPLGKTDSWSLPIFLLTTLSVIIPVAALLLFGNSYHVLVAMNLIATLLLTLSLNLVVGNLGLLSFAHAVFFGASAYVCAILSRYHGINPWLCLPAAMSVVAIMGFLLSAPLARLRGIFFAVASLAFASFFEVFVREATPLTQGGNGISGIPFLTFFGIELRGGSMLVLHGLVLLLVLILLVNISKSSLGRELSAVRDNESAASACGISVVKTRLLTFILSALIAAVAGWLFTFTHRVVVTEIMSLERSFFWFFTVLIGGPGSIVGVSLGTIILLLVPSFLNFATSQQVLLSGVLMLAVVLFAPKGISGIIESLCNHFRSRT
jgi:branched-chain amino acid transport system permease protein